MLFSVSSHDAVHVRPLSAQYASQFPPLSLCRTRAAHSPPFRGVQTSPSYPIHNAGAQTASDSGPHSQMASDVLPKL